MSFSTTDMEGNYLPGFGNFSQQMRYASISDVNGSKIKKLFAESVEVSLALCHQYLGIVGQTKLTEIVNQIIPTGWVLSTGYWPYYSDQHGHCLCVCCRFGVPCRHVRSYDHWLDLSSASDFLVDQTSISLPRNASVTVTCFECTVTQMGGELYNINAKFQILVFEEGKLTGKKQMWIDSNYKFVVERYPNTDFFIMFHPNPQSMLSYGKILNEVLINSGVQDTYVTSNSSKQTFVPFPNSDVHPYMIIAFAMLPNSPTKTRMSDASTQIEESISEIPSYRRHQQFRHHSLAAPQHAFQTPSALPSASTSYYNQPPPPYSFPPPNMNEEMRYRERFDGRGRRRSSGGAGSSREGFGDVTLSMFLPSGLNQPPQAFRGRKQRKAGRRPKVEIVTSAEAAPPASPAPPALSALSASPAPPAPPAPNDLAAQMDAELSLIEELFN